VRLEASGEGGVYELPITQEQIADATGMTPVHTNRTIQALRKEGHTSWSAGRLAVHDWPRCEVSEISANFICTDTPRRQQGNSRAFTTQGKSSERQNRQMKHMFVHFDP
jgi:hypothetical protein